MHTVEMPYGNTKNVFNGVIVKVTVPMFEQSICLGVFIVPALGCERLQSRGRGEICDNAVI